MFQLEQNGKIVRIPIQIKLCQSFWCRLRGLMFLKKPIQEEALLLHPCNSIHMFFMRFPIDALFLDQQHKIVKVYQILQPWTFVSPVESACSTLELPAGTVEKYGIHVGQRVIMNIEKI